MQRRLCSLLLQKILSESVYANWLLITQISSFKTSFQNIEVNVFPSYNLSGVQFCFQQKTVETFFIMSSFGFHRRKKVRHVWNNMRVRTVPLRSLGSVRFSNVFARNILLLLSSVSHRNTF